MKQRKVSHAIFFAAVPLLIVLLLQIPALSQEGRIVRTTVCSRALQGNVLGDSPERNVTIYLPPAYDDEPERRFPVVYLLHGYLGTDRLWMGDGYVKNLDIAHIADKLIAEGRIREMIVVAPNCHNRYGGSWYTNSPVTGNWEDFVTKELIRHIDAQYRTIAKRDSRGIAGHSMGGHGAIKLAMKHPDLYCALYAMSPAWIVFAETVQGPFAKTVPGAVMAKQKEDFPGLHWRSRAFIALAAAVSPNPESKPFFADMPVDAAGNRIERVWQRWEKQDLVKMIGTHRENLMKYKSIALDCGTDEDLLPMNKTFAKTLADAHVQHTFEIFKGDHLNRVASQSEVKVLPMFSRTLEFEAAEKRALVPIR